MQGKGSGRKRFEESERRQIVQRFKESGLKIREFCAHEKISEVSLRRWRKSLVGADDSTGKFLELEPRLPEPVVSPEASNVEVRFPSGVVLRIGA